jgi:NAD+ synthase (glutamine-hydrolysing)
VAASAHGIDVVFGHPELADGQLYNAATYCRNGEVLAVYYKQFLPNYAVFDEKRYFQAGSKPQVITLKGVKLGLLICEDVWEELPAQRARAAGAELVIALNASPYAAAKHAERVQELKDNVVQLGMPVVYVNLVGGQDELVFDGMSFCLNGDGSATPVLAPFAESLALVQYAPASKQFQLVDASQFTAPPQATAEIYAACVLGLKDYVEKNRFPGVLLGLSGGIDSALTLAMAVDALGAARVHAVMMPFTYTSELSKIEAAAQAELLGVRYSVLPIEDAVGAFLTQLKPEFGERPTDITEENLQSRCRGVLLMALSNKFGSMVMATGNKSEMAVGYATLYGDMCGGFAPLKDLYKTEVYRLCTYRNSVSPAIPQAVIDRPPSAELAPGQVDQDSLPPYPELDAILQRYIEQDRSVESIIDDGFDEATVKRVIRLLLRAEYKRRQAPPGTRITRRAFGRDRRYPITSGWRDNRS